MADPITEGQAVTTATTASDAASPASAPAAEAATPATQPTDSATLLDGAAKPTEGDAPKPGDKPAEEAKPIEYTDFKVPEGVELKGEALDELKAFAKEKGLSQEDAQKLVDLGAKQSQAFQTQVAEQAKAQSAEWAAQTKGDKEIGGDALPENLAAAKQALDKFGSPELKSLLNQSGLGNHPEVVRFMVKAGKAISEDGRLVTGAAGQKDRSATPIENRLYPNQK
ncbi:peptidase [Caballeronia zhejiangensis]|uniref:peptidase n=1 Tax=Caballeronia zhejiangensis TaxID=871203 RepID=UPI0015893424|nr:peptidase [Caballeronia zhejiangensis]